MARPHKTVEVHRAPFDLRHVGPLSKEEVSKRLKGRSFWAAPGRDADKRATVDATPCELCAGTVEWALTTKRLDDAHTVKYVYARCRKDPKHHRWDFRHSPRLDPSTLKARDRLAEGPGGGLPTAPTEIVGPGPNAAAGQGAAPGIGGLGEWLIREIAEREADLMARQSELEALKAAAAVARRQGKK